MSLNTTLLFGHSVDSRACLKVAIINVFKLTIQKKTVLVRKVFLVVTNSSVSLVSTVRFCIFWLIVLILLPAILLLWFTTLIKHFPQQMAESREELQEEGVLDFHLARQTTNKYTLSAGCVNKYLLTNSNRSMLVLQLVSADPMCNYKYTFLSTLCTLIAFRGRFGQSIEATSIENK